MSLRTSPRPLPKRNVLVALALSGSLALCIPLSSHAAPPENDLLGAQLEDLLQVTVSGASKFEQPVSEAPAAVSVITADAIKLFGYRTLADILRAQRGMFVTDDRNYSYIGIRGFGRTGDYNTRLLILVDGHRINDNTFDSVYIGNDFILDLDLIDRVEIIRGPASSLYGNNAFFGVVNVITRHARGLKGVELASETGHLNTNKGRISYGASFANDLAISLSGSYLDSQGRRTLFYPEFDAPSSNNGIASNLDGERSGTLFASATWRDFSLQGGYVTRRKDIPTGSYGTVFNLPPNFTDDTRAYANLKYERSLPRDWWLQARLYYDHYFYHGAGVYLNATPYVNRDAGWNNSVGTDLQFSTVLADKHRLIGGTTIVYNNTSFDNYDVSPYASNLRLSRSSVNWSAFLQDEYAVTKQLILNLGLRYDHYKAFGGEVSPRGALIYSPTRQATFKLVYGEAFRSPNNYELYYTSDALGLRGNPGLTPEKIQTYELIYEQLFLQHYKLTASGFHNNITKMIKAAPDDTDPAYSTFKNLNRATVWGAEGELEAKWQNGFSGRLSYTYQNAIDESSRTHLANSPRHLVKANLILPLIGEKLLSGIEMQYMGTRRTLAGSTAADHLITNLTLFSQKWIKGLECSFSIYNLLDKRFADPASEDHLQDTLQQNGISWRFKAAYRF